MSAFWQIHPECQSIVPIQYTVKSIGPPAIGNVLRKYGTGANAHSDKKALREPNNATKNHVSKPPGSPAAQGESIGVIEQKKQGAGNVLSSTNPHGLVGTQFKDWLKNYHGGTGSFKKDGREFDGAIGNRWYEAKSGNYWRDRVSTLQGTAKFKSDMGQRLQIAKNMVLHMNCILIPLFPNTLKTT